MCKGVKFTKGDLLIGAYLYNQRQKYSDDEICSWYGIYKKKFINACEMVEKLCVKIGIKQNTKKLFNVDSISRIFIKSNLLSIAEKKFVFRLFRFC